MIRGAALLLTLLTGFTGLVSQLTWQKYFVGLLGSDAAAATATLGILLAGLGLGQRLFAHLSSRLIALARADDSSPRHLSVCGAVQLGLGAYALLFPLLFTAARALSGLLPDFASSLGFLLDSLLLALLVGPPTILMGATIPLLTQALSRDVAQATRTHALVVGQSALGVFAGALVAGYWMISSLGLVGTGVAMGCINLAVGAAFAALGRMPARLLATPVELALDREARITPNDNFGKQAAKKTTRNKQRAAKSPTQQAPAQQAPARQVPARQVSARLVGAEIYCATALLVGFAMMTVLIILLRIGSLSLGSSEFTSALVVAVFALCFALGSFAAAALKRISRVLLPLQLWALFALLVLLYLWLPDAPYWAHALRASLNHVSAMFWLFQILIFLALLGLMGPALLLAGAALPMIFHRLKAGGREAVGSLGDVAGRVWGWHTSGAVLGVLVGGYGLFFGLDLHDIFRVAVLSLAGAATLISYQSARKRGVGLPATLLACALAVIAILPAWSSERLSVGLVHVREPGPASFLGPDGYFASVQQQRRKQGVQFKLLFYEDDALSSVAVKQFAKAGEPSRLVLHSSGGSGSSSGSSSSWELPRDYRVGALAAILPALFAERVERAFVVGFGTGVSAGELGALESIREVQVVEPSPALIRSAHYFDDHNLRASKNPKIQTTRGDAYRSLLRGEAQFDVIVSQASPAWQGRSALRHSREFLSAARDRLSPGGVYALSLSLSDTSVEVVLMILRTHAAVFENISLWYLSHDEFLILAFQQPRLALDLEWLEARAQQADFQQGLARSRIQSFPALLAHEFLPLGVLHAADLGADLGPDRWISSHTLKLPRLGHAAARAFYVGDPVVLPSTAGAPEARIGRENSLVRRFTAARGSVLSDSERLSLVQETCLYQEALCVPLIALWFYEDPHSPALKRIIGPQRSGTNETRELILGLSEFYQDVPEGLTPENVLSRTQSITSGFERYYHHAAPYSRRRLEAHWRACSVARCADARPALALLLGEREGTPGRALQ